MDKDILERPEIERFEASLESYSRVMTEVYESLHNITKIYYELKIKELEGKLYGD